MAVRLDDLTKTFGEGAAAVRALDGVSLSLRAGTFTAIMGPSGSGKTTLLRCAAGLESVDAGTVRLTGQDVTGWSESRLARLRRSDVGFVFQDYSLLPYLTARENVALPLRLARRRVDEGRVDAALAHVGLAERAAHRPGELSGGQQQRVAVARALVASPAIVFADEPTGALDTRSGEVVMSLLAVAAADLGRTVAMVTHDPRAAAWADRVVFLVDGRIVGDLADPTADEVAARMSHLDELVSGAAR